MTEGESARRGAWTLVATGLGLFMIFLDATIVNVALPDIQREFDAGETGIQWVVAAYSLTMAMFMMSGATFGDHYGRRLPTSSGSWCSARAGVRARAFHRRAHRRAGRPGRRRGGRQRRVARPGRAAYPDKAKAKAIGIWTGIAAIGLAIGPTLGGVLTEDVGWRSIFLFNPFIGAVAIWSHVRSSQSHVIRRAEASTCPDRSCSWRDRPPHVRVHPGTRRMVLADHPGLLSPRLLVVIVVFVRFELRARDPMMDMRVFKNRVYTAAIYAVFATLFCVYGTLFVITQYFQNVRTYSPEKTGILILAMTIPTILSPLTGRIAARGGRGSDPPRGRLRDDRYRDPRGEQRHTWR